jgi:hypothetical protein
MPTVTNLCRKRNNHIINVAYACYESDMKNNTMNIISVKSIRTVAMLSTDDREYEMKDIKLLTDYNAWYYGNIPEVTSPRPCTYALYLL